MQSPNKVILPTIVVTAPSSFADTISTSPKSGSVLHISATSKLHVNMIEDADDEDYEYPAYSKSLGPKFRGVEELVSHPKADDHYFRAEMPDGSKTIMAKLRDVYTKRHTSCPAFQSDNVSDEVRQNFLDVACDMSEHKPHLLLKRKMDEPVLDQEEPRLNIGCFEHPRQFPAVWNEDFD